MALKKIPENNQRRDSSGATSKNDVAKANRRGLDLVNQPKRGTTHLDTPNEVVKAGRDDGFGPNQTSRGATKAKLSSDADVKRLGDGISSVSESY